MLFKVIIVGALLFYLFRVVLKPPSLPHSKKDEITGNSASDEAEFTEYEEVE